MKTDGIKLNILNDSFNYRTAAVVILILAISGYNCGLTWSVILALSSVAILIVYKNLTDGDSGEYEPNSFENLYCTDENESKQKRMLAKRKENHINRNQKSLGLNDTLRDKSSESSFQDGLSPRMMENFEFSAAEDFDAVGKIMSPNDSFRKQIPSLRSPQPLISAVKSRICIRDSKREHPLYPFGNKYPMQQNREVFKDLQNASSPYMSSTYRPGPKESFMERTIHKAISPLNGRYFSRINPEKIQDSIQTTFLSPITSLKSESTWSEDMKTKEVRGIEDTSTETVVKALKEKITSKRKRNLPSHADLSFDNTVDTPIVKNKKRRLDNDKLENTTNKISPSSLKDEAQMPRKIKNQSDHSTLAETSKDGTELMGKDTLMKNLENERNVSKYGMKDEEMNLLAKDENEKMDVCGKQCKRKADLPGTTAKKEKKDVKSKVVKTISKTSKIPKRTTVKKTPVKSVETQTPTKIDDENEKEKINAKTPKELKTPYRRIFSSGFPSNLKPGSTEKRRRIPIYFMSAGDSENISISREEYGEYGVTSEAFQADKKAAAERAKEMINAAEEINTSESTTSESQTPAVTHSSSFGTASMSQNLIVTSTAVAEAPKATGLSIISNTSDDKTEDSTVKPNIFGNQSVFGQKDTSSSTSQSTVSTTDPVKPLHSSGFNFGSVVSSDTATIKNTSITTNSTTSISTQAGFSLTAKPTEAQPKIGFNLTTAGSGLTFGKPFSNAETSLVSTFSSTASASVVPTSATLPATSGTTPVSSITAFNAGISFGTPSAPNASQAKPLAPQSLSTIATTTAAPFGGFSFGQQAKQDTPKPSLTANQPSACLPNTADKPSSSVGGFSFGTSSDPKPSAFGGFSFGNTAVSSSSSSHPVSSSVIGFSFNTSSASSLPTNKVGGFSFGAPSASQPTAVPGVFSVGSKPTPSSSAGGFSFPTAATQSGFTFGTASAAATQSSQSQLPTPFGNQSATQASTLFQSPALTQSSSVFNPGLSSNSTNLFGQPASTASSSSSIFGANSQPSASSNPTFGASAQPSSLFFGAASQSAKTSAPLFGTPSNTTTGTSLFGAAQQNPASSTLFGAKPQQPAQSSAPLFGAPKNTPASFSFGNTTANSFAAASSSAGGFSFTNAQKSTTSSSTQNAFGQTINAGSTLSFGQSNVNPFSKGPAFGQTSSTAATKPFAFGQTAQAGFSQPSITQSTFGSSTTPAFGSSANQSQPSGFSFGSSLQKPGLFSFSNGQSGGGLASRPGTPTPAGGNQPPVQAPGAMFGTPQPQVGGFALGSGTMTNRPQIKGKRRTRR